MQLMLSSQGSISFLFVNKLMLFFTVISLIAMKYDKHTAKDFFILGSDHKDKGSGPCQED